MASTGLAKLFTASFVSDIYSSEFAEGADVVRLNAENAITAADSKRSGEAKVAGLLRLADYFLKTKDASRTEEILDEVGKLCRQLKFDEGKGYMLIMQAKLELWYGSAAEAMSWSRDALKTFKKLGKDRAIAFASTMHAFVLASAGKPQDGLRCAKEAMTIYQQLEERSMEVGVLRLLMEMFIEAGDALRAGLVGWEIVKVVSETGGEKKHRVKLAEIIRKIADIQFEGNDMEKCMEAAEEACSRFQESGDVEGEAAVMKTMMNVYFRKQKFHEGIDVAKAIVELYREAGFSDRLIGSAMLDLTQAYLQSDCLDEAVESGSRALAVFQQAQDVEGTEVASNLLKDLDNQRRKDDIKLIIELNRSRLGSLPTNLIIAPDGLDIDVLNGFGKQGAKKK